MKFTLALIGSAVAMKLDGAKKEGGMDFEKLMHEAWEELVGEDLVMDADEAAVLGPQIADYFDLDEETMAAAMELGAGLLEEDGDIDGEEMMGLVAELVGDEDFDLEDAYWLIAESGDFFDEEEECYGDEEELDYEKLMHEAWEELVGEDLVMDAEEAAVLGPQIADYFDLDEETIAHAMELGAALLEEDGDIDGEEMMGLVAELVGDEDFDLEDAYWLIAESGDFFDEDDEEELDYESIMAEAWEELVGEDLVMDAEEAAVLGPQIADYFDLDEETIAHAMELGAALLEEDGDIDGEEMMALVAELIGDEDFDLEDAYWLIAESGDFFDEDDEEELDYESIMAEAWEELVGEDLVMDAEEAAVLGPQIADYFDLDEETIAHAMELGAALLEEDGDIDGEEMMALVAELIGDEDFDLEDAYNLIAESGDFFEEEE
jgi:hypothetical protein